MTKDQHQAIAIKNRILSTLTDRNRENLANIRFSKLLESDDFRLSYIPPIREFLDSAVKATRSFGATTASVERVVVVREGYKTSGKRAVFHQSTLTLWDKSQNLLLEIDWNRAGAHLPCFTRGTWELRFQELAARNLRWRLSECPNPYIILTKGPL